MIWVESWVSKVCGAENIGASYLISMASHCC